MIKKIIEKIKNFYVNTNNSILGSICASRNCLNFCTKCERESYVKVEPCYYARYQSKGLSHDKDSHIQNDFLCDKCFKCNEIYILDFTKLK